MFAHIGSLNSSAFTLLVVIAIFAIPARGQATFQGVGDLPGGVIESEARGVSADGSTVVGLSKSGSGPEAFHWTSGVGMIGLGDLAGGVFESRAFGVSADGSVVVGYSIIATDVEAFL